MQLVHGDVVLVLLDVGAGFRTEAPFEEPVIG
jgi:hypothetical protein